MDSGSSSGTQKVTQNSTPWSDQIPYLDQAMQQAQAIYNKGSPSYYPFSTVAPVAPETQSAWSAQAARAANGSPVNAAAKTYLTNTINGAGINPNNPALTGVANAMWAQVAPAVASQFEGAGRYGSGAQTKADTTAFTNAIAPYNFQNLQHAQDLQQSAAGMAPAAAGQDYIDTAAMGQVGAQRTAQAQSEIQAAQDRYNYDANAPGNWLTQYIQSIQGNYGGSQTTKQPVTTTPWWQSLLSAGAGAAGLAFG